MNYPVYALSPDIDNALVDSARWSDLQWVHDQLAWPGQHDPMRRMEPDELDPFCSITNCNHIKEIKLTKDIFFSAPITSLKPVIEGLVGLFCQQNLIGAGVDLPAFSNHVFDDRLAFTAARQVAVID